MPHDKHGEVIQPGDRVTVEFVVKEIHQTEDFCNCNLETVIPMPPDNRVRPMISVNARQTQKVTC